MPQAAYAYIWHYILKFREIFYKIFTTLGLQSCQVHNYKEATQLVCWKSLVLLWYLLMPEIMHEKHLKSSPPPVKLASQHMTLERDYIWLLECLCNQKQANKILINKYILVCSYSRQILVIKRKSFWMPCYS
jgi:hypothetical protein